ncbi:hypothetical protein CH381_30850 [Leptospira sp. mixed culture ATI2-C-A1]|nr:hypothetical protein CH381_30850 [Leptospira sp. mixed culture ATI2-C-A1]
MPISQRDLLVNSFLYSESLNESVTLYKSQIIKKKTAFLCHSHKDELLAKGLIAYLKKYEIDLYVDWLDHSLPETPNKITAQKIQSKIVQSDLFLFLATENSMKSRWCPWEIGYADASQKEVLIIPTSSDSTTFGNEYLQLYERIDIGYIQNKPYISVFNPTKDKGILLKEKINSL